MKETIYIVLMCACLLNCNSKNSNSNNLNTKSRLERVDEIPYRNQLIDDELKNSIEHDVILVLDSCKTLDKTRLFYFTEHDKLIEVDSNWINGSQAIKYSYELWRTNRIKSTIVTYPSFAQNATTGESQVIYVIEIEHSKVTGTFKIFFDSYEPKKMEELKYYERL